MKKYLNNPEVSRKYNYVYKLTNLINNKIYIGVHRTDILNDSYFGSGKSITYSVKLHGKENFKKEILNFFETYKEALDYERLLVTPEFCELDTNYNLKEGGTGSCYVSIKAREYMSKVHKELWKNKEHKDKMLKMLKSEERCKRVSISLRNFIDNNKEEFLDRIIKINKDPEKIRKTAEKHRGMKRTIETRRKQSKAREVFIINNGTEAFGKGAIYIHNPLTKERKRVTKDSIIPEGWKTGLGKLNKKRESGKKIFIKNLELNIEKLHLINEIIPTGWILGRLNKCKI